jgi:hypothetical protein
MRRDGWAILVVMLATFLLAAIGVALGLAAAYDALASANVRGARSTFYAAEAGLERAVLDLPRYPDWDQILSGTVTSSFRDGAPAGLRDLPGGGTLSLDEWVNLANCARPEPCDAAAMDAVTEERRWGENNPRWRLFGWGPLSLLVPDLDARSEAYLAVLVADDPTETDSDPTHDGATANAGRGVLVLRASAFASGGSVRTVEATVARSGQLAAAVGYQAQRGGGQLSDAVAGPVGSLIRSEMSASEGGMVRR